MNSENREIEEEIGFTRSQTASKLLPARIKLGCCAAAFLRLIPYTSKQSGWNPRGFCPDSSRLTLAKLELGDGLLGSAVNVFNAACIC